MALDKDLATRVFMPSYHAAIQRMKTRKLAYYTSVDTAISIIEGRSIWMRNASKMNDVADVEHGIFAVDEFISKQANLDRINDVLGTNYTDHLLRLWQQQRQHLTGKVYITCFSEHPVDENDLGRLSMWRAYCSKTDGVALVLNTGPFFLETNEFNAYSSPVLYGYASDFEAQALQVLDNIVREQAKLGSEDEIFQLFFVGIMFGAVCLKHPGFAEEQEWRIVHMPMAINQKSRLRRRDNVLNPPETIFEIPLENDEEAGLVGFSADELVDRIIIGPSSRTPEIKARLVKALTDQGATNPEERIIASGIPLRPIVT